MYTSIYMKDEGVLLSVFSGRVHTDADYLGFWEAGQRLDADGCARADGTIINFMFITNNAPRPGAVWRKRFAEGQAKLRAPQRINAIVTQSALIRGTLTVINWLSPAPENHEIQVFSNAESALQWLERRVRRPMTPVRRALENALRQAEAQSSVG
jgi:hypothetical protein